MKNASRILYIVGLVFNAIGIALCALAIAFSFVMIFDNVNLFNMLVEDGLTDVPNALALKHVGIVMVSVLMVSLAYEITALVLVIKAQKMVKANEHSNTPHIIMLVIGVLGNIFYLIGGILGIAGVSSSQPQQPQQPQQ